MKTRIVMAGMLGGLLALFGCGKPQKSDHKVAEVYTGLRQRLLALDPKTIGLNPLGNKKSPLSPLFYKARDVIAEARMAEEQTRAEQGGGHVR